MSRSPSVHCARPMVEPLEDRIVPAWFMKMDTIPGESAQAGHTKELELLSFSWGTSRHNGGGTSTTVTDLNFAKQVGKASPKLYQYCASGKHIKSAVLTLIPDGTGSNVQFYKATFKDVLVSGYSLSSGGDRPMESFSLNFAKMKFEQRLTDGTSIKQTNPPSTTTGADFTGDTVPDPLFFHAIGPKGGGTVPPGMVDSIYFANTDEIAQAGLSPEVNLTDVDGDGLQDYALLADLGNPTPTPVIPVDIDGDFKADLLLSPDKDGDGDNDFGMLPVECGSWRKYWTLFLPSDFE